MDYPAQLTLAPEVKIDLENWIDRELMTHLGERTVWIQDINNYQRDYIAKPSEEKVTFPFEGASNLVIPLTAIAYEAIHARTMGRLRATKEPIGAEIYDPSAEHLDAELEHYLNEEIVVEGNMLDMFEDAIMELEQLGTGVAQATFEKVTKKGMRKGKEFEVTVREGSVIKSTAVTSFLMPFECLDPQTARWCGEVFWIMPDEVAQRQRDGFFAEGTVEKLDGFYSSPPPQSDALYTTQREEERENRTPAYPIRLEFYLIYTQWCVDPSDEVLRSYNQINGYPDEEDDLKEICFVYHKDSRQIVACWYNWFEDLRRPYRKGNYFKLPYRWTGIGIAQQNEQFQKEVTTQHRQTIDNATIANCRMWKVRKGNTSVKDNEPIFPNKVFWVDEMDDVQTFENQEIYASSYNNENQAVIYSQQRTGVNELTLGMPGVGTPGTATDSTNRLQESARKNDYVWGNIKSFTDQLLHDSIKNIVQWGPNIDRLRYSPLGPELEMFLKRPYSDFHQQLCCRIALVDANSNQMLDRQTTTQLAGVTQQYYSQILPLLTQFSQAAQSSPLMASGLISAMKGANAIFTKILQSYNIRDPQKYLVPIPPLPNEQPQQPPNSQLALGAGAGPDSGGPPNFSSTNLSVNAPNLQSVLPPQIAGMLGNRLSQSPAYQ